MLTITVILAIWVVLSLPLSVVLGFSFQDDPQPELVGMDGDLAVFQAADGTVERISLADRASY
jgi:hypothetical protein